MERSKFTEAQVFAFLKEGESRIPVTELGRTHGMSEATFFNWI